MQFELFKHRVGLFILVWSIFSGATLSLSFATTYQDTPYTLPRGIDYIANTSYRTNATYSGVTLANETPYKYFTNGTYLSRTFWTSTIQSTNWITPEHWDNLTYNLTNCSGEEVPLYDSNLVAFWRFNGNVDDGLGNYNGTLNGDASYTSGKYNDGVALDGDGDYITLPATPETTSYTISIWFKPAVEINSSTTSNITLFQSSGENPDIYIMWRHDWAPGKLIFRSYVSSSNYDNLMTATDDWKANIWYNVVITYDGSTKKIYVNGVLENTSTTSDARDPGGTDAHVLGAYYDSGEYKRFFNGSIDYVVMYKRTLSAEEIQKLYNSDTVHCNISFRYRTTNTTDHDFDTTNLTGYWKLDWNLKDNVTGASGTAYNGASPYDHGLFGGAYSFDGQDDYIDIGEGSPAGSLTYAVWVNPSSKTTSMQYFMAVQNSGNPGNRLLRTVEDGRIEWEVVNDNGTITGVYGPQLTPGWHYVVGVLDTENSVIKLYLDGELVDSAAISGSFNTVLNDLQIGKRPDRDDYYFKGLIDSLRVYNRTLSSQEIKELYYHADFSSSSWSSWQTGDTIILNTTSDYLQYEAKLETDNPLASPKLTTVNISATDEDIGYVNFTDSNTWHGRVTQDTSGDYHVWANITLCPTQQLVEGHYIYVEANNIIFDFNGGELTGTNTDTYHYDGNIIIVQDKHNLTFYNFSLYHLGGWIGVMTNNSQNVKFIGNGNLDTFYALFKSYNSTNITFANMSTANTFSSFMDLAILNDNTSNVIINNVSVGYCKFQLVSGNKFYNLNITNVDMHDGSILAAAWGNVGYIPAANIFIENVSMEPGHATNVVKLDNGGDFIENVTLRNIYYHGKVTTHSNNGLWLHRVKNLIIKNVSLTKSNGISTLLYLIGVKNATVKDVYLNQTSGVGASIVDPNGKVILENITIENARIGLSVGELARYTGEPITLSDIHINHVYIGISTSFSNYDSNNLHTSQIYVNDSYIAIRADLRAKSTPLSDIHVTNSKAFVVAADSEAQDLSINGLWVENATEPLIYAHEASNIQITNMHVSDIQSMPYYSFNNELQRTAVEISGASKDYIPFELYYNAPPGTPITNKYSIRDLFDLYDTFNGSDVNTSLWNVYKSASTTYSVSNGCLNSDNGYFQLKQKALLPNWRTRGLESVWIWGEFSPTDDNFVMYGFSSGYSTYIHTYNNTTTMACYNVWQTLLDEPFLRNESKSTLYGLNYFAKRPANNSDYKIYANFVLYKNNTYLTYNYTRAGYKWSAGAGYLLIQLNPNNGGPYTPQKLCGVLYGRGADYGSYYITPETSGNWSIAGASYNRKRELAMKLIDYYYAIHMSQGPLFIPNSELGGNLYVASKYSMYLSNSSLSISSSDIEMNTGIYANDSNVSINNSSISGQFIDGHAVFTLANSNASFSNGNINATTYSNEKAPLMDDTSLNALLTLSNSSLYNSTLPSRSPSATLDITNMELINCSDYELQSGDIFANITLINSTRFEVRGGNISNITIQGGENVLTFLGMGSAASISNAGNTHVEETSGFALRIKDMQGVTIPANTTISVSNSTYAIYLQNVTDATLQDLNLTNNSYNLFIENSSGLSIANTQIIGGDYGLWLISTQNLEAKNTTRIDGVAIGLHIKASSHVKADARGLSTQTTPPLPSVQNKTLIAIDSSDITLANGSIGNITLVNASLYLENANFTALLNAEHVNGTALSGRNVTGCIQLKINDVRTALNLTESDICLEGETSSTNMALLLTNGSANISNLNSSAPLVLISSNLSLSNKPVVINATNSTLHLYNITDNLASTLANASFLLLTKTNATLVDSALSNGTLLAENSTESQLTIENTTLSNVSVFGGNTTFNMTNTTLEAVTQFSARAAHVVGLSLINSSHITLRNLNGSNISINGGEDALVLTDRLNASIMNVENVADCGITLEAAYGNISNLSATGLGNYSALCIHNSSNLSIEEVSLTNFTSAIKAENSLNLTLRHINATNNSYGILFMNTSNSLIEDNYLCLNAIKGIFLDSNSHNNHGSYNTGEVNGKGNNAVSANPCYSIPSNTLPSKERPRKMAVEAKTDGKGDILITVKDKVKGKPLEDARVLLKEMSSAVNSYIKVLYTDDEGQAWFKVPHSSKYLLRIRKDGYSTYEEYITVEISTQNSINIQWKADSKQCTLNISATVLENGQTTDETPKIEVLKDGELIKSRVTKQMTLEGEGTYSAKASYGDASKSLTLTLSCEKPQPTLTVEGSEKATVDEAVKLTLYYTNKTPADHINVYVEKGEESWAYITDENGQVVFTPFTPGNYTYKAEYPIENKLVTRVYAKATALQNATNASNAPTNETTNSSTNKNMSLSPGSAKGSVNASKGSGEENETANAGGKNQTNASAALKETELSKTGSELFTKALTVEVDENHYIVVKPNISAPYKLRVYRDGQVVYETTANGTAVIKGLDPGKYRVEVLSQNNLEDIKTELVKKNVWARYLPFIIGTLVGIVAILLALAAWNKFSKGKRGKGWQSRHHEKGGAYSFTSKDLENL